MSRAATQSARGEKRCAVGMYEKKKREKSLGDEEIGPPEVLKDEFGGTVDELPSRRTNCGSWERSWEVKGFIGQR